MLCTLLNNIARLAILQLTIYYPTTTMSLTIHHLQVSQSERIPWLCEELQIPYSLKLHQRAPIFSPQSIEDLNPLGQAPVIQDGSLTMAESAACVEYIIQVHGHGKLALRPSQRNYADYIYWFHFANGTLQPHVLLLLQLSRLDKTGEGGPYARSVERFRKMLALVEARLVENTWLAGDEFTAADIMTVFTLTTMRMFYPFDLTDYQGILGFLQRVSRREGYRKARAKADPGLEITIEGKAPRSFVERLKAEGKL